MAVAAGGVVRCHGFVGMRAHIHLCETACPRTLVQRTILTVYFCTLALAESVAAPSNRKRNRWLLFAPTTVCFHIIRKLETMHD